MKIVKIEDSQRDSLEIKKLMEEKARLEQIVNAYTVRIRELIYKYDTAKMDFKK